MTTIRVASDLHLEFFRNDVAELASHFLPKDNRDHQAVLVLAGDISARPGQLLDFLAICDERFAAVLYVPGNHEYYRHDINEWDRAANSWEAGLKRTRIAAGGVGTAELLGVHFVACTLWGDGGNDKKEHAIVGAGLADFKVIRRGGRTFTVADMQSLNQQHRSGLVVALRQAKSPAVVVTHHLPSHSLCHPRFGTLLNGGFASACDGLMRGDLAPALWIHGHTHDSMDSMVGRTRVVCNPAGYQPEWGSAFNEYFAAPKFVEVAA